jgi:uncharacterized protein (TIGR02466 family)
MPIEYFFPKAFYYKDELTSEDENGRLLQAAHALRQEIPESSRTNLYTTYGSVANVLERSEFAVLRDALIPPIVEYLAILETREGNRCVVTDSWVSISAPGNCERMHTHDGSYVSGAYYIKTAPGCGELYFEELQDNLWASRRMKAEHFNTVSYTPVERRVILFNSRMAHHVGQNMSSEDRIALSFNVALL